FGLKWTGPFDSADAARHSSAMTPIGALVQPATALLPFTRGAGDPGFNHVLGQPAGTLAWMCNTTIAPTGGLIHYGPYLTSLPVGAHTVHYRLAVSATSTAPSNLVQLVVLNQSSTAASAVIPWNQFVEPSRAQDFALTFTNNVPGNNLEFRAFWIPFP